MMNDIICIATNLFRIYLIYRFIKVFIGGSVNKGKELLVYGMFFLINTALYLTYHAAWINLTSNLIGISILISMYTRSMKANIFVTAAIYVINAGCDAFCISSFVNYEDGKGFNQFYSIITVFLIFICELLAEKIVNHKKKIEGMPEEMIHSFDIVVILGNILENAIEAAEQTKEKLLDICIELKQGVLHIELENSFNGNLVAEDHKDSGQGFLRTTKEDKNHHGIGLSSVRRIVEKYNGTMKVSTQGEKFKIKIILYM